MVAIEDLGRFRRPEHTTHAKLPASDYLLPGHCLLDKFAATSTAYLPPVIIGDDRSSIKTKAPIEFRARLDWLGRSSDRARETAKAGRLPLKFDEAAGMPVESQIVFKEQSHRPADRLPFTKANIKVERDHNGYAQKIDVCLSLRSGEKLNLPLTRDSNRGWCIEDFQRLPDKQRKYLAKFLEQVGVRPDAQGKIKGDLDLTKSGSFRYQSSDAPDRRVHRLWADGSRRCIDFKTYKKTEGPPGKETSEIFDGKRYRKNFTLVKAGDKTIVDFKRAPGEPPLTVKRMIREASSDGRKNTATFVRPSGETHRYDWSERSRVKTHDKGRNPVKRPVLEKYDGKCYRPVKLNGSVQEFMDKRVDRPEKVKNLPGDERLLEGKGFVVKENKQKRVATDVDYRNGDHLKVSHDPHGDLKKLELTVNGKRFSLERKGRERAPGLTQSMSRADANERELTKPGRVNTWTVKDDTGKVIGEKKANIVCCPDGTLKIATPTADGYAKNLVRFPASGESPHELFRAGRHSEKHPERLPEKNAVPEHKVGDKLNQIANRLEQEEWALPKAEKGHHYYAPAREMLTALLAKDPVKMRALCKDWIESGKNSDPADPKSARYHLGRCNHLLQRLGVNAELRMDEKGDNMFLLTDRGHTVEALSIPLTESGATIKSVATARFIPFFEHAAGTRRELSGFKVVPGRSGEHEQELSQRLKQLKERIGASRR